MPLGNGDEFASPLRWGEETVTAEEAGGAFWVLVLLGGAGWYFAPNSWTDPIRYSTQYKVNYSQVYRRDKPSDCDYDFAPLGKKGCYYQKVVGAYNAAGDLVGGDNAPKYDHDRQTGKPIISYDDGKSWAWAVAVTPDDLTIKTVRIGWTKVKE
jgi:hypothetical protein